jgi:pimeloyl-ACP methyl ester carboxylesterase
VSVTSTDGVRLALASAGDPARPTIVLIHGYPDSKEMWDPVAARLAERFHVVAYDVRGAGASDVPRETAAYDFDQLGDDLGAVIDAVAPGKRVHIVGHDWGGLQGWEFATVQRFEGRLASFTAVAGPSVDQVALGGMMLLRERRFVQWLLRIRRSWYIGPLLLPGGPTLAWRVLLGGDRWRSELRRQGVPVDPQYPAPTFAEDGVNGARLYRRNMPRRSRRPRRDAVAHVPVQLIIPTADRYIPRSYYDLAERYAPQLRRRELDGPHWLPRTHPAEVADWIAAFVEEVEAGAPAPPAPPAASSRT